MPAAAAAARAAARPRRAGRAPASRRRRPTAAPSGTHTCRAARSSSIRAAAPSACEPRADPLRRPALPVGGRRAVERGEVLDGRAQAVGVGRHRLEHPGRSGRCARGYPAAEWPPTPTACSARSSPVRSRPRASHEDERTVAFMDINPATRGHLLVIPREHATDLLDDRRAGPRRGRDGRPAARAARAGAPRRRRREPAQLLRPRAWQTVFHFHLHVIPRYEDDPLRLPVDAGARRPGRDRRGRARPEG